MRPNLPLKPSLVQEFAARRIRLTGQRKLLLRTIQENGGHLDAATILKLARKQDRQVDRATVYRTLDLLKRHRLVAELDLMHLDGEKHFYEAANRGEHIHLACIECGKIEEFESVALDRLKREITRKCGFDIRVTRLEVGGRCRECCRRFAGRNNGNAGMRRPMSL